MTERAWPEARHLDLGPETLAVYDYGRPDGGGVDDRGAGGDGGDDAGDVVLLHGMTDVARGLEPLARALSDRYRVVAYDARGHGRSSHPGAYSVLHHVADLHALLDRLDIERPILIGHSLGGHTVANWSGLYPDRPRAVVLLEGMGPPTVSVRPDTTPARLANGQSMVESLAAPVRHHRPLADLDAAAERLRSAHPRLDVDRARVLAAEATRTGPDGGLVWRHDERAWHWVTSIDQASLEERWAAIAAPILAVSGAEAWERWWQQGRGPAAERVRMTDDEFAARLGLFADIEHVELAEAGHLLHYDQPARVLDLVERFLADRLGPGVGAG